LLIHHYIPLSFFKTLNIENLILDVIKHSYVIVSVSWNVLSFSIYLIG